METHIYTVYTLYIQYVYYVSNENEMEIAIEMKVGIIMKMKIEMKNTTQSTVPGPMETRQQTRAGGQGVGIRRGG